ncbi:unknown protein [Seminavis robusta]|uniref:Uncharacterized protein n=1 Tax=Seminavis robusta TaxID=568900 RepID=A0A9N8HZK5_9STRA|nr:unknown protein [Seminavis robusta]|eukprot:Sro2963_g341060.1 n/a (547) ;mRNA; r:6447-8176
MEGMMRRPSGAAAASRPSGAAAAARRMEVELELSSSSDDEGMPPLAARPAPPREPPRPRGPRESPIVPARRAPSPAFLSQADDDFNATLQASQQDADDDLVVLEEEDDGLTACERVYRNKNNSQPDLLSMCIGLKTADNTRWLADFENDDLYKDLPQRSSFCPKVMNLKIEIRRRAKQLGAAVRCSALLRPQCIAWLKNNPIQDVRDIAFLRLEEAKTYRVLEEQKEERDAAAANRLANSNWNVHKPWLRLYMAMCHDAAREALMMDGQVMNREELDARNSDERPPSYAQVVAGIYNDATWTPVTEALPELHSLFEEPISLPFNEMPGGEVSQEEVKTRIADSRARLISIIFDWELSGNGFGQRTQGDGQWGHFSEQHMELEDGDNRANFVKPHLGQRIHHLYLWHLSDSMEILTKVLNVLSGEVAADSERAGDTAVVRRRRRAAAALAADRRQRKKFRNVVGSSLSAIAITNKEDNIRHEEDKVERLTFAQLAAEDEGNDRKVELYGQLLAHHKAKIGDYQDELAAMKKAYNKILEDNNDDDEDE